MGPATGRGRQRDAHTGKFRRWRSRGVRRIVSPLRGGRVHITVQVEPTSAAPAAVEYRWDTDTAILTASLADAPTSADGVSGSVEVAGNDGSWVILDVKGGSVRGVEIAVWPDVHKRPALRAPADAEVARLYLPASGKAPGIAAMQMDTTLVAEADQTERTIHF